MNLQELVEFETNGSQAEFARRIGVNYNYFNNIYGERSPVTKKIRDKIYEELNYYAEIKGDEITFHKEGGQDW